MTKRPDSNLLAKHSVLRAKVKEAEAGVDEARQKARTARRALDDFEKTHGDVTASAARVDAWEFRKAELAEMVPDPEWLAALKARNEADMIHGIASGWWPSLDERGNPLPFPTIVKRSDFPTDATMAHVLVHLGLFPSVTQAVKNGKGTPIKIGEQRIKRPSGGIIRLFVED